MIPSFHHVQVDSRKISPGDLFFAIKGELTDGHLFLEEAKRRGAVAAIVSKRGDSSIEQIVVEDPIAALQEIARKKMAKHQAKVVAITGSYGKTTTKDFLATLLEGKFSVWKTPGNSNSQIGLPMALINGVKDFHDVVIAEMGMDRPGQIQRLTTIVPPDISAITAIALVHAENFDTLEEIAQAKAEILPPAKIGIVPHEWKSLGGSQTFSLTDPSADFFLETRVLLPADHFSSNFLIAKSIAELLGMSKEQISARLPHLTVEKRRFQMVKKEGITIVDDSYNASVETVKAALLALPEGRKIAVLGEMLELGKFSKACHKEVGRFSLGCVDQLFTLGKEARVMYDVWQEAGRSALHFSTVEELLQGLKKMVKEGDVILVKGSNSTGLSRLVDLW